MPPESIIDPIPDPPAQDLTFDSTSEETLQAEAAKSPDDDEKE